MLMQKKSTKDRKLLAPVSETDYKQSRSLAIPFVSTSFLFESEDSD